MKAEPDNLTIQELIDLRTQQMLVVNPEYQRGVVWTPSQKKKLVDSVLRGYPIPLMYLHHIKQTAGRLQSQRYEVIDGQQRISALADFHDGAFRPRWTPQIRPYVDGSKPAIGRALKPGVM